MDSSKKHKVLFEQLVGDWEGKCRTWFEPDKLADESKINATISTVFDDKFLRHTYQSTVQSKARSGEELLAFNSITQNYQSSWIDDFHMNYAIMFSEGPALDHGFVVSGNYDVGENQPRWGWKTVYKLVDDNQLSITAYNITPTGEEAKAVETTYVRLLNDEK